MEPRLVLASASPRRAQILRELGLSFRVTVSHVDEALRAGEDGAATVERLARAKAATVARGEALPVLGADTEVISDGRILGKPRDAADARAMLLGLAGREHEVVTGLCLAQGTRLDSAVERTVVRFASMSASELAWYAATGEPLDKTGSYAVQAKGAALVARVDGCYTNVVGLPVGTARRLLAALGVRVTGPR